jgi:hypothetical protein
MKDYNETLRQIRKEIMAELVAIGNMKFYTGEIGSDEWYDSNFDLPQTFRINKWSHYINYAITEMYLSDGGLLMVSAVDTEESEVEEFTENTLSLDTLMDIYEYIKYAKLYPENETAK